MDKFKTYWLSIPVPDRKRFADHCKTTESHLRNVAYGKTCGEDLAMHIEIATGGQVTCEELRPDLADQWAYLRGTKKAA